jgi:hypothetical protein
VKHHRGDTPSWGCAPPLNQAPEGMRLFYVGVSRAPNVHPSLSAPAGAPHALACLPHLVVASGLSAHDAVPQLRDSLYAAEHTVASLLVPGGAFNRVRVRVWSQCDTQCVSLG